MQIKKYHSGWIWTGDIMGFALIQFSGSPKFQGKINEKKIKNKTIIIFRASFEK